VRLVVILHAELLAKAPVSPLPLGGGGFWLRGGETYLEDYERASIRFMFFQLRLIKRGEVFKCFGMLLRLYRCGMICQE
jgi:hypothetical protein